MRVLVVEDYFPLAYSMQRGLQDAGYAVDVATDGESGLDRLGSTSYDAVVLDITLPKVDGWTVLARLRLERIATPVLVLTARGTTQDRVHGLDLGADDYLVKPFVFEEFLARVRAAVRRRYRSMTTPFRIGDVEIDTVARTVRRDGRVVVLSAREYALLEYLAGRRGQVVSREDIQTHVYDFASQPSSNVVDVYVGYLRRKLAGC